MLEFIFLFVFFILLLRCLPFLVNKDFQKESVMFLWNSADVGLRAQQGAY